MNKKIYKIMWCMLFIAAIAFLFVGGYYLYLGMDQHWRGYHNVDLGQNIRYLNAEYNLDLVDYYEINETMTGEEAISIGFDQFETSMNLLIMGGLLVGLGIGLLTGIFDALSGLIK